MAGWEAADTEDRRERQAEAGEHEEGGLAGRTGGRDGAGKMRTAAEWDKISIEPGL